MTNIWVKGICALASGTREISAVGAALVVVPFLLFGVAIALIDARTRLIPRRLVACAALAEISTLALVTCAAAGGWGTHGVRFIYACNLALSITALHVGLWKIAPHAIGLGDAWTMGLAAMPVDYIGGINAVAVWLIVLCASGSFGLLTAAAWHRTWRVSIAFAPFIVGSACVSLAWAAFQQVFEQLAPP